MQSKLLIPNIFLCIALCFGSLNAQLIDQHVQEETLLIEGVSTSVQKARVVGELDEFRELWRDFLKDEFDIKTSRKGEVILAEKVVINRITDRRGDLILFIFPLEKEVEFNVAFKLGYDVYLNSAEFPDEAQNLKDFAVYFINYYYYRYLEDYIKQQEKNFEDLNRELRSNTKAITKADKTVAKLEKNISKNDKRTDKLRLSLETAPEQEKEDILGELNEIRIKNSEYNQEIAETRAPLSKHEEIIKTLEPKIEKLEKQLNQNRLMYIEARDRIKR